MRDKKKESDVKIEFHADDYGLFPTQSRRILDCHTNGNLNGISIMPNSTYLEECVSDMRYFSKDVEITVHLNLIEGYSLSKAEEIPLLADRNGILRGSFFKLLLHSFLPGRNAYRTQLKKEISAQIGAVKNCIGQGAPLRIDGHAHYHMIPVVFDALMDVIREEKLNVSYIRIPREYPSVYLRNWKKLKDFSCINLVKVAILNLLSGRAEWKYAQQLHSVEKKLFLGVLLSGRMHYENVSAILPDAVRLAGRLGRDIEILAHPGGVYEETDIGQITNAEDMSFLTSQMRKREKTMFLIKNGGRMFSAES